MSQWNDTCTLYYPWRMHVIAAKPIDQTMCVSMLKITVQDQQHHRAWHCLQETMFEHPSWADTQRESQQLVRWLRCKTENLHMNIAEPRLTWRDSCAFFLHPVEPWTSRFQLGPVRSVESKLNQQCSLGLLNLTQQILASSSNYLGLASGRQNSAMVFVSLSQIRDLLGSWLKLGSWPASWNVDQQQQGEI